MPRQVLDKLGFDQFWVEFDKEKEMQGTIRLFWDALLANLFQKLLKFDFDGKNLFVQLQPTGESFAVGEAKAKIPNFPKADNFTDCVKQLLAWRVSIHADCVQVRIHCLHLHTERLSIARQPAEHFT